MSEALLLGSEQQSPPRMRLGLAGSILLHGSVVALLILAHSRAPAAPAQMMHLELIAAPEGAVQTGIVDAPKPDVVVPKTKKPVAPPKPTTPTPATTKTARSLPEQVPPPTPAPPVTAPAKAAPAAGGGTGGKGADVATISVAGQPFENQAYLNNVVNAIGRRFGIKAGNESAIVTFRIRRDGSVNVDSLRIVKHATFNFEQAMLTAVESAVNQKAFGPLPAGFTGDGLFVTFIFDGRLNKQ